MRGIGIFEFGGPEVLREVDFPERHAAAGEVRIRVQASTVNPTDTYLRKGARAEALRNVPPPYVPGMDVAGVIDEIGAGTKTHLAIGDADHQLRNALAQAERIQQSARLRFLRRRLDRSFGARRLGMERECHQQHSSAAFQHSL